MFSSVFLNETTGNSDSDIECLTSNTTDIVTTVNETTSSRRRRKSSENENMGNSKVQKKCGSNEALKLRYKNEALVSAEPSDDVAKLYQDVDTYLEENNLLREPNKKELERELLDDMLLLNGAGMSKDERRKLFQITGLPTDTQDIQFNGVKYILNSKTDFFSQFREAGGMTKATFSGIRNPDDTDTTTLGPILAAKTSYKAFVECLSEVMEIRTSNMDTASTSQMAAEWRSLVQRMTMPNIRIGAFLAERAGYALFSTLQFLKLNKEAKVQFAIGVRKYRAGIDDPSQTSYPLEITQVQKKNWNILSRTVVDELVGSIGSMRFALNVQFLGETVPKFNQFDGNDWHLLPTAFSKLAISRNDIPPQPTLLPLLEKQKVKELREKK